MIKLVKNEFIKIGYFKLNLPFVIFATVILVMKEVESLSFDKIYSLISFIGLCNCALFGGIISNEIENGTFRMYLTKPVKRNKVYLSKYIMMGFYTFILSLFIYFAFVLIIRNFEFKILFKYLIYTLPLYLLNSIIIFVSTIIRNTAIVVSICIFLLVFSLVIVQILFGLNFKIMEYSFLPYLDFSIFNDKSSLNDINASFDVNLSLKKGIIVDIVNMILIYLFGSFIFINKDIKN
jgi:ABC-type transport system involved in multi-copper enzyme maturation permease subunit